MKSVFGRKLSVGDAVLHVNGLHRITGTVERIESNVAYVRMEGCWRSLPNVYGIPPNADIVPFKNRTLHLASEHNVPTSREFVRMTYWKRYRTWRWFVWSSRHGAEIRHKTIRMWRQFIYAKDDHRR